MKSKPVDSAPHEINANKATDYSYTILFHLIKPYT